jgi:hypothetical protein
MKLKPILFLAAVGGVVTAVRKRGASNVVEQVKDAAPQPVKEAVEKAVDKVQSGDNGDQAGGERSDETRRYAAPVEAGAQPPATSGGPPSDATQVRTTVGEADDLATKAHDLPKDTVMPDTSNDDPSVQEAEAAAASDAAQIGGKTEEPEVP